MDIEIYGTIKQGLKDYFNSLNITKSYKPNVVGFEPNNPTYPMIKFQEPNNTAMQGYQGQMQTVATLGHRVDIYAKTNGSITKQDVARVLAKHCNEYLTRGWGLRQLSYNEIERDGANGDLYHIIIVYTTPYYENGKLILRR